MTGEDTEGTDDRLAGFVGDGREKHLVAHTADGERREFGNVYVKHAAGAYAVSEDPDFPPEGTERLAKSELVRVEVDQHHSTCFITTAAGDADDLAALRRFRDGTMAGSRVGRGLVAVYERVSPPIARTTAAHPNARATRLVRWLVGVCAGLARRHETAGRLRPLLAVVLVALYVVGVACAAAGHAAVRARQPKKRSTLSRGR